MSSRHKGSSTPRSEKYIGASLPEISARYWVIDALFAIGPIIDGKPITYNEIKAYMECTYALLDPKECEDIHYLSRAYLDQWRMSDDKDCPAPYVAGVATDEQRKAVSDGLSKLLGNFKPKPGMKKSRGK